MTDRRWWRPQHSPCTGDAGPPTERHARSASQPVGSRDASSGTARRLRIDQEVVNVVGVTNKRRQRIAKLIEPLRVEPGSHVDLGHDFDPGYRSHLVRKA